MGQAIAFEKEKLIVAVIYHDPGVLQQGLDRLIEKFGPIEDVSEEYSFSKEFSTYYDSEIGGEGFRKIYSFRDLVSPDRQAEIKTFTNAVEASLAVDGNRKLNLDPGFINIGRLMLATTKNAGFRIPLADGIYAEITLFFARGGWHDLPWTYRDYQSEDVKRFLTSVHKRYLEQRKTKKTPDAGGF